MRGFLAGVALAWAVLAVWAMLRAGRRQLEGRLEEARAQGRKAGLSTAAACTLFAVMLASPSGPALAACCGALGAGVCGLLGGLSGKPVPAAWLGAALLGLGLLASLALLRSC